MPNQLVQKDGQVLYINDSTRNWVESVVGGRIDGLLQPNLLLRMATDTNYINNRSKVLPAYGRAVHTHAIMNIALPGQRIPHVLNWNVQEGTETEVSTASFEILNALTVSSISSTLTTTLPMQMHSTTIAASYVQDSLFVTEKVNGNVDVETQYDSRNIHFREEKVNYRQFAFESFTLADGSNFPDPGVPDDDDNDIPDDNYYPTSSNGIGSYYVKIGNEVVRVCQKSSNTFYIPCGGRAINGVIEDHDIGEEVTILGFGPSTGEVTALGYLSVDDFKAYKALLRPGAGMVSYEGYGTFTAPMEHAFDEARNYEFTGYWFVQNTEDSLGDDGVPRIRVNLQGPGMLTNRQQITMDVVQRMKNTYGAWYVDGQDLFSAAGHTRDIPGDWVDYNSWDPTLKGSYPLKIKTEIAQHKEFFDHMQSTELGSQCEVCRKERSDWLKSHKEAPGTANLLQRQVGRHIYKESIRVIRENGGPIKTYLRLMHTMAMAAWDHPPLGVELAQRFTKIPYRLFEAMQIVHSGLIYNGQLDFSLSSFDKQYDWSTPGYNDMDILSMKRDITCPFESEYDKTSFSQPVKDLAEMNDLTFWINREGFPVLVPKYFHLRPIGAGFKDKRKTIPYPKEPGEWFISYGGSMSAYSKNVESDAVLTQAWVTATTCFESTFTIATAGTGFSPEGKRIIYGALSGHKEGLALTSGVQQADTISMDNAVLGLDWNVVPASWGIQASEGGNNVVVGGKPQLHTGTPTVPDNKKHPVATKVIQRTINWFLERRYINPIHAVKKYWYQIPVDGEAGDITKEGILRLETFLKNNVQNSQIDTPNNTYGPATYHDLVKWFQTNAHYIQFDVFWYAVNGRSWDEYLAHITGIRVPMTKNTNYAQVKGTKSQAITTPKWIIDEAGLQTELQSWQKQFIRQANNVGNRRVDDSINKATARTVTANIADPRVQPGDVLWVNVPGIETMEDEFGRTKKPYTNGVYVTQISRQMDLTGSGVYTATYSGHRYTGDHAHTQNEAVNPQMDFIGASDTGERG